MKTFIGAAFGAALSLCAASAVAQPAPLMTVLIKPGKVDAATSKGDIDVTMTIPDVAAPAGAPFLSMGMFTPGLARPAVMDGLTVSDAAGPVPMTDQAGKGGPHSWVPGRAIKGVATVRYRMLAENIPALSGGPPTALRVDGAGISGVGGTLLISPAVKGDYRIALKWDVSAMGPGAEGVSSWGDGDVTLPAGPVERLGRAVYMAGPLKHETHGAFSAVWVGGQPPFDPRPSMQWTADLHKFMSGYFKDKSEPPYRVFMRFNPMNAGGGAALTNSFLVTYGKDVTGESFKAILGHEMAHTWTANEIGKWYSEGNAVYYQALIPWKAGLFTTDQYLQDLNETAYRYFTNALRATPEDQVVPRFWEDTRIRVLPYDRGAMYFAVLNGKVRKASGGKRSIDDLILIMIAKDRAGEPLTEQTWVDLLRQETGEAGPAVHASMMAGGLMLPESDDFGPCFRRVVKKMRQFDLGFDNASIVANPKIIKGLKPGSEAAKAGLREGDQVTYGVSLDAVQGEIDRLLNLQVTRDGKTFPLSYLPRGEPVDAYQWERAPGATDAACKS
ncbi:MAG: peptidase M61 [Alphaproteobacteria bacterium]|nr:peptidase M61 [Alphaproteobacteria bacterium]MBU1516771.1 peptidase M61 [Alphaproteobacteria bacterium]MBU2092465.1 peptidase M61 [Alphaproteobacteria bacterium]MBU2152404.1 peptidase M61 [Alphaproteobacteria bacterium]MBU2305615.1 peptidase M61 [Alphaproteobacteria bacterium]